MEYVEKINKIAAKEVEIQNKTSEIIERKTKFSTFNRHETYKL